MNIRTTSALVILTACAFGLLMLIAAPPVPRAEQTGKPEWGRTDPSTMTETKQAHAGANQFLIGSLIDTSIFETSILWIHRGIIPQGSGIGEHTQRDLEDMFIVFNTPAEFTINDRTALLPAGTMVPCIQGYSHGIYNAGEESLQWMNLVTLTAKDVQYKITDLGFDLKNQELVSPAPFLHATFDRTLLRPVSAVHGGAGTLRFRRVLTHEPFTTNVLFMDHLVIPPGGSIGLHWHDTMEEVYYLMDGAGRVTVNEYTWDVRAGDMIPCTLHDSHGIFNPTDTDLELFVWAVSMERGKGDATDLGDDLAARPVNWNGVKD